MTTSFTIEKDIHIQRQARGRQELRSGVKPPADTPSGKSIPRLARLMALAIRFDGLLHSGQIRDQAELARLGHVTRARISQILSLVHLAPDIQEEILFFEREKRRADVLLADVRPIYALADWATQRRRWHSVLRRRG